MEYEVIRRGIISGYDEKSCTAVVTTYEGDVYADAIVPVDRYDLTNGAFSFTPPSIGAPCLYSIVGDEVFILCMFPASNVSDGSSSTHDNPYDNSINRFPTNAPANVLPGESTTTSSFGAEESFTDTCKKIIMSPGKLQSIWNIANFAWDAVCTLFSLRSGSMDVTCNVDENDKTKTTIDFKRSVGEEPPIVNINIGTIEGSNQTVIVKINNKEFLTIDPERNVKLTAKDIQVVADNISVFSNTFNCLNVDRVDLP